MIFPLLMLAAGVVSALVASTKPSSSTFTAGASFGGYTGPVGSGRGQLSRILVYVPAQYTSYVRALYGPDGQKALLQDLKTRILSLGYDAVLLATQDPSSPESFKVLVRGAPSSTSDDVIRILSSEALMDPTLDGWRGRFSRLDLGLSDDEQAMFEEALLQDSNPRHLRGVASSLEPTFVCSASVLRAKAALIDKRVLMTPERSTRLLQEVMKPQKLSPTETDKAEDAASYADEHDRLETLREDILGLAEKLCREEKIEDAPARYITAAKSLVVEIPLQKGGNSGIRFVSPSKVSQMFRARGDEGFVSPSALELVLAGTKPVVAGVANPSRAHATLRALDASTSTKKDVVLAKNQIAKARKAIERRRHVEWYRRQRRAAS